MTSGVGPSDNAASNKELLSPLKDIGSIDRYKGWLSVDTKALVLPSGELWEYDVVRLNSPQGVAILPFLDKDTVLLCKQYRPAVRSVMLELIQGGVFEKEQSAAAAARELKEETGYRGQLKLLYDNLVPLAGSVDHRMTVYVASSLEKICEPTAHEKERLVLVEKKWSALLDEIYAGEHKDLLLNFGVLYLEARCGEAAQQAKNAAPKCKHQGV
jgi:ADP-ribose pyrophosphatase